MIGGTLLEKGIHHCLLNILNNFPMLKPCVPHLKHLIDILEESLDQNELPSYNLAKYITVIKLVCHLDPAPAKVID